LSSSLRLFVPWLYIVWCLVAGIGFGGLWRFAGPFTKVCLFVVTFLAYIISIFKHRDAQKARLSASVSHEAASM